MRLEIDRKYIGKREDRTPDSVRSTHSSGPGLVTSPRKKLDFRPSETDPEATSV